MKAIVRTAAAGRSRLGNAQVASPTLAAQSAPLLASEPLAPTGMKAEATRVRAQDKRPDRAGADVGPAPG